MQIQIIFIYFEISRIRSGYLLSNFLDSRIENRYIPTKSILYKERPQVKALELILIKVKLSCWFFYIYTLVLTYQYQHPEPQIPLQVLLYNRNCSRIGGIVERFIFGDGVGDTGVGVGVR